MKQLLLIWSLFLVVLMPTPAASQQTADSTQRTTSNFESQTFEWTEAAKARLLSRAQQGDASSQMWLGCAYEQGWFGKTSFSEALKWFRRSAEQGNPDAQNGLGQMYQEGEGVPQNYTIAADWYRKAAEHVPDFGGAGQGRNNLGLLYLTGYGVPKDYVQAYMWLSLSGPSNPNVQYAKEYMTTESILEAERLVRDWKIRYGMPMTRVR